MTYEMQDKPEQLRAQHIAYLELAQIVKRAVESKPSTNPFANLLALGPTPIQAVHLPAAKPVLVLSPKRHVRRGF